MTFDLGDYVDVAERIRVFIAKYPDGSLQGEGYFVTEPVAGYHYRAEAYRTPDDPRPGIGTAFEPIPGKTPYTKDSEVMNAETSAWGRAIVALGFETKKVASANEVRNRSDEPAQNGQPTDGGDPAQVVVTFGKKHKDETLGRIVASDRGYLEWMTGGEFEPKTADQRRIVEAARLVLAQDDGIPF